MYQPFYIGGIENVETAKDSAFGAMMLFVTTFIVSVVLWFRDLRMKRRQLILARHAYDPVLPHDGEDGDAVQEVPMEAQQNFDLPTSVTNHAMTASGLRSRRSSGRLKEEEQDNVMNAELESSYPHVPEGQLLPTTHV